MLSLYMSGVDQEAREKILTGMRNVSARRDENMPTFKLEYATDDHQEMIRIAQRLETISVIFIGVQGTKQADIDSALAVSTACVRNNRDHYLVLTVPTATLLIDFVPHMMNVSGFLIAPYPREQVERIFERIADDYRLLGLTDSHGRSPFIALKYLGSIIRLHPEEILYVEAQNKKLQIHRNENDIAIYENMDNMKTKLGNRFFHCHRSYLVNCDAIRRIDLPQMEIELLDGTLIPISRTYKENAKALLAEMESSALQEALYRY